MAAGPHRHLAAKQRWHPIEVAFWLATLLPFVLAPTYLTLASQIAITAIFAVSLDLIMGYAGLVSLGHAAYFGLGAYTAGLIAKAGWGEPFSGLVLAGLAAGLFGYLTGFLRGARPPPCADHDHTRHRPAALRGGEPRGLAHRRQ